MSKAVERLVSRKRAIREATLAWLEAAARTREPEYLQLSSHTELLPAIKAAQRDQVSQDLCRSLCSPFALSGLCRQGLLLRGPGSPMTYLLMPSVFRPLYAFVIFHVLQHQADVERS